MELSHMQSRSNSGTEFEKKLCESLGYRRDSKSPKIKWPGTGSNLYKIKNSNYDFTKFEPISGSTYNKWDAIAPDGSKREIKKYTQDQCKEWKLYSEPILKICTNDNLRTITQIYGDGDINVARKKYNIFIVGLFNHLQSNGHLDRIVEKLSNTNIGIEFEDGFVPKSELEFRWIICYDCWQGFHRIMLEFKIRSNETN